jgi:divinyl protochlorophyllide a 8-vinyl-reductase
MPARTDGSTGPQAAHASASVAAAAARTATRVGPNAIIQVVAALDDRCGHSVRNDILRAAALPHYIDALPNEMVEERDVKRLFDTIVRRLPTTEADAILTDSGRRTARYVRENRIPRAAQLLLRCLPRPVAARLLLTAIAANAWTFAGSGQVSIRRLGGLSLDIAGNPFPTQGCPWHVAVIEGLFRALVSPLARVRHTTSRVDHRGPPTPVCRFDIAV